MINFGGIDYLYRYLPGIDKKKVQWTIVGERLSVEAFTPRYGNGGVQVLSVLK